MKKKTKKSNKTRKSKPEPKDIAVLRKKAEKRLREQTDRLDELSEKNVRQLAHELGTHQIELEMQNEELRGTRNELETSRNKYSDLYDFSPAGYFTFDKNGLIYEVNLTGANLLGIDISNLINRPFSPFIDKGYRNVFHAHCAEVLKKNTMQTCEIRLRKKDGTRFYAHLQSIPIKDADGKAVYCRTALSDISERKQSEELLKQALDGSRQRQAEIAALLLASRVVLEQRDFKEASKNIFDSCKNLTGATAGYVALLSEDGTENEVLFLDSGGLPCTVDPSLPMPIRGLREVAYRTGKAVYENDFSHSEWVKFMPEGHTNLTTVLFAPLVIRGKAVGLLGLGNKPGGFTENDARLATAFGELAAISLHNSRLTEALQNSKDELELKVKERTAELGKTMRELEEEIAERRRAEDFAIAERERFNLVLETLPAYLVLLTPDYHVAFANRIFRERFGESHGRRCFEYLFNRSEPCEICETYTVLKTMAPHHWEWTGPDSRNYDIYDFPFTDTDGSTLILEMGIDITDRKQAEASLRKTSELLERVFSITHVKVAYMDKNLNFIRVNRAYAEADGRDPEFFVGKNHFDLFPYGENEKIFRNVVETGEPYFAFERAFEYAEHPERGVTYWDWSLLPVKEADGRVSGILLTLIDVTERKRAEEKASVFENLINQSSDAIFVVDPETAGILEINDSACTSLGLSRGELLRTDVTGFSEKQYDLLKWKEQVSEIKEKGHLLLEDRLKRKDGTVFPVEVSVKYVSHEKKDYLVAIARDTTERKETEYQIRITNMLLKLFSQKISRKEYLDAVVVLLSRWTGCRYAGIRILNKEGYIPYESYLGFNQKFLASESLLSLEKDHCICIRIIAGTAESQEISHITLHGSFYSNNTMKFLNSLSEEEKSRYRGVCIQSGFTSVAVIPILYHEKILGAIHLADERGEMVPLKRVEFVEALSHMIGEAIYRFNAEEELKEYSGQLRKLTEYLQFVREEERTRISREIHDELGQSLTALKMDVSWLKGKLPQERSLLIEKFESMLQLIDAIIKTVQRISSELRPGVLDHLGLAAAIDWQAKDFQNRTGINCDVKVSPEDIEADKDCAITIFRIFQEALTNVARHSGATNVSIGINQDDAGITLVVEDNGRGITSKEIFDPGSFGLIGMRERVNSLGGNVKIEGEKDGGTKITVSIPSGSEDT